MYIGVPKLRDSINIVDEDGMKILEMEQNESVISKQ